MDEEQLQKEKALIVQVLGIAILALLAPGLLISYPIYKTGVLKPKHNNKASVEEMLNFFIVTIASAIFVWIAVISCIVYMLV